ncbi:MAG: transporter substrate-binding domain-containing protein [Sulfurospirillaceae bacterium]|nr:transporter substrate-binding domain-containing protein [Sulfurospirillaceae bacterium]
MRLKAFFFYGIVAGWVGVTALFGADPLVYAGPNPPFNFRDKGEVQGLGVDLLNASLSSLRPKLSQEEIRLDVWKDVYAGALAHPSSFLISTARLKEREALFQWVGPLATVKLGFIAKKTTTLPKGDLHQIVSKLKIATIKETAAERMLLQMLGSNTNVSVVRLSTPLQGYKMLENGRIDALVYTDIPFVYYLVSEAQDPKQYHMLYLLEESYYYIAAGKDVPKSQIAIMQTQLDRLKEKDSSGTSAYERIMKTYLKGAVLQGP